MSNPKLSIVTLYPDLLGTYGDSGNGEILAARARFNGIDALVRKVSSDDKIPIDADIYLIGGGEDGPQQSAVSLAQKDGGLTEAYKRGAQILAICAGFQIIGLEFPVGKDLVIGGLGLIPVRTVRSIMPRCVGELLVLPDSSLGLPLVSGYENHSGQSEIISGIPLGRVMSGVGNSYVSKVDGFINDTVIASYCHGPILARNPDLADLILSRALGRVVGDAGDYSLTNAIASYRNERIAFACASKYKREWNQLVARFRDLKG